MTSRQARRAAERRNRKLIRKGLLPSATPEPTETPELLEDTALPADHEDPEELIAPLPDQEPAAQPISSSAPSPARLTANRANARLSTGSTSASGKDTSKMNALKTALTGRTVLLPTDDGDRYERHLAEYNKSYRPVGERECEIVQKLADSWWRLDRIPGLEEALYVKGCNEFAGQVVELDPRARLTMLRMHTYVAYERQFRNLQIQEMRLLRMTDKLKAELKELQKEREEAEREALSRAAMLYTAAKKDRQPFDPARHGFEFSTEDVEAFLHGRRARQLTEEAALKGEITPNTRANAA